jgi:murein DD-endopeptidase MepM/ murein hydrolase activator NlpD
MKLSISALALSVCSYFAFSSVGHAQVVEFNQLPSVSLGAPLPVAPFGTTYYPILPPYVYHTTLKLWGYGTPTNTVIPSITFAVDDDKGTLPSCSGNYPKHLGIDYAAPAGTAVYAIADGVVRRANGFTGVGDYYVVVESGSLNKWTTLYGHLNAPPSYFGLGTNLSYPVKKGDFLGTLYNYRDLGDIPHLHLGIRGAPYSNVTASDPNSSTRGYACATDSNYQLNKYKFVSPQAYNYYTPYW